MAFTLDAQAPPPAPPVGVRAGRPSGTRLHASPWAARLAAAAVVAGSVVRIEQFVWGRSLWLDEAFIANNIVHRSFAGLMRPLSDHQGAPLAWLWAERAAVITGGNNEYALRALPLVAGVAALVLVYRVAQRVAGPWPAVVATWGLALAPSAVRYSVEVKQYSSDMAVALGLTLLALRAVRSGRRHLWWWGVAGAVAVWWSHPAVMVLAGTAVVLGADAAWRSWRPGAEPAGRILRPGAEPAGRISRPGAEPAGRISRPGAEPAGRISGGELAAAAAASAPWVLSVGVEWLVSLRRLGHDRFLHVYWASGFAPRPLAPATFVGWLGRAPLRLVSDPGQLPLAAVGGAVAVAGLMWAGWRRPVETAVVVAPLGVASAAAAAGVFPMEGRIALWLLPVLWIGLGAAAAGLCPGVGAGLAYSISPARTARERRERARRARWAGGAAGVCALAALAQAPLRQVAAVVRHPTTWTDLRPLLGALHRRLGPTDVVWVHDTDAPSAAYYALSVGVRASATLHEASAGGPCPPASLLAGAARGRRVWFVYGYRASDAPPDQQQAVNATLATMAHLVAHIHRPQANAWLWDFGSPPDRPAPGSRRLACVTIKPAAPPVRTGLSSGPLGSGLPT